MSSTKRKQNKPQKIFNSKFNNKSSEVTTSKINSKISNNSCDKSEIKETESTSNLTTTTKEEQVWRVINDISSPKMKETKQNESINSLIQPESSSLLDAKLNETLLSLMQPSSASGILNNNLVQTIEKIILMNLTPYLFGMMNNSQLQSPPPSLENNYNDSYFSAFSAFKKQDTNQFDLIKESFESLLPKNNSTPNDQINSDLVKKKKVLDDLNCSCGSSFNSLENLQFHLKQTNHKARVKTTKDELDKNKLKKQQIDLSNKFESIQKSSTPSSTSSSVCLSPSRSPNTPNISNKMVRGQEEWVKNSRDNNFIAQILKCLECSASFETLSDLSYHMLQTNHFSKIHHQTLSAPLAITSSITSQNNFQSNSLKSNEFSSKSSLSGSSQPKQLVSKNKKPESPASVFSTSNVSCRLKNAIINQTELNCLICNKKFDHLSNSDHQFGLKSQQHQQQHQLPPLVKLIQHLQNVHKITNVCTNCGAFFKNTEELQRHLVEESYNHHNLNNQLTNSSNKNKLKRTSSNSNLNIKKFKSDNSISRNNNQFETNDFNNSLKLNLLMNNKQRNETNDKYTNNLTKLNTNSISPSSSTSSYSYSSSNSSPSSFTFEQSSLTKLDSHPLLALQMFVNGSNILCESSASLATSSLASSKNLIQSNQEQTNKSETSKLPAKKRPYIEDINTRNEFENSRSSFKQLTTNHKSHNDKNLDDMSGSFLISKLNCNKNEENCFKRSKPASDELDTLTKENKKCHSPLNLLQKMQIGLDDYLMR